MNIDELSSYYTGKNITVALIDSGVDAISAKYRGKIYHYIIKEAKIVKLEEGKNTGTHGKNCADIICSIAPDVTLIDIKVMDEEGEIKQENIVKAIELSITQKAQIINISLGVTMLPNPSLKEICDKANELGITIIAAGYDKNVPTYPADFDSVDRVDITDNIKDKTISWNNKSFLMNRTTQLELNNNGMTVKSLIGSSFACAKLTGIFALVAEALPLSNPLERKEFLCRLIDKNKIYIKDEIHIPEFSKLCTGRCVIIPAFNEHELIINNRKSLNLNIVGCYDPKICRFTDFHRNILNTEDYDSVIFVNSEYFEAQGSILEKYIELGKSVYALGKIEEKSLPSQVKKLEFNLLPDSPPKVIAQADIPTIGIMSTGWARGKINVQLMLAEQLKDRKYASLQICTNPIGFLFGMIPIDVWNDICFPSIVYKLNNFISYLVSNGEYDIVIINVGGGVLPINSKLYNHNFGASVLAFLYASFFDTFVFCTDLTDNLDYIQSSLNFIENIGNVKPTAIAINNEKTDINSIERPDSFLTMPTSLDERKRIKEKLAPYFECPQYLHEEIMKQSLVEQIIDMLS